jgi:hypothetical protein
LKAEELFREVDEELQREKLLGLWRQYGGWVIAAVVVVIVGVAAFLGWQRWQEHSRRAQAQDFAQVMQTFAAKRYPEAALGLSRFAATASPGFATVARFDEARAQIEAGDQKAALATLSALADDPKVDPLFRSLASLLDVSRQIDTAEPKDLIKRLQPLTASGTPWRQPARILLATAALRAGDKKMARKALEDVKEDATAPVATQRLADQLLKTIGGNETSPAKS